MHKIVLPISCADKHDTKTISSTWGAGELYEQCVYTKGICKPVECDNKNKLISKMTERWFILYDAEHNVMVDQTVNTYISFITLAW